MAEMIDALDGLADGYAAIFCDVWGVVHNGVDLMPTKDGKKQTI